jgi:hypothetical protein
MDMNSRLSTLNSRPSVELHIERLIVDESLLFGGQSHKLQIAIESELTRLVRENGLTGLTSTALYSLPARNMSVARHTPNTEFGRQIARTVYAALSPQSVPVQDRHRKVR